MPILDLEPGSPLAVQRGEVVVCIPVYGAYDLFAQCLRSVLEHTPPSVPVLVCDDASPDPRFRRLLADTLDPGGWEHCLAYLRQPENRGFVENVNSALALASPADVVLLNSDCIVTAGWLEGLRAAAHSESRIATATALTNAGTIVSIPHRNRPVPQLPSDTTPDRVSAALREVSLRLRPDLPTCIGHCVYIRRDAIDLVGDLDTSFSPGYEEEVDFSQRCVIHGLRHVAADDVFVLHRHGGSFGHDTSAERLRAEHHAIIAARYAWADAWFDEVRTDPLSPLARSVAIASGTIRGLSVTIDGRCLGPFLTGTQRVTLELISALDIHTDVRIRVLVPDDLGDYARSLLGGRPDVEVLPESAVGPSLEPTEVVHRAYQVTSARDAALLRRLGHRLILTQQDDIALRNPAYFGTFLEWQTYRKVTRATLAAADHVVFISRHAAQDARTLELVEAERSTVIPWGTDGTLPQLYPTAAPPPGVEPLAERPFLVCLGTDFLHKNRLFAIRLLESLLERAEFDGALVLAGPRVSAGSSAGEEAAYLAARPALAARVYDIGAVDEPGKQWLLERTAAVVYPTTYEGFGLIPFEAAEAGTPCVFARVTSLADYLPEALALIVPWDPAASAERVAPVLVAGEAREAHVRGLRVAGARLTYSGNAKAHADLYRRVSRAPATPAAGLALEALEAIGGIDEMRRDRDRWYEAAAYFKHAADEVYADPLNRGLVGPGAVVPRELRRAVLAVATRPALRRATLALYRAGRLARGGGRDDRPTKSEEAT